MAYIRGPIDLDPQAKIQEAIDFLATVFEDWEPNPASLEVRLMEAFGASITDIHQDAATTSDAIFQRMGTLLGRDPLEAIPAQGTVVVAAVDDAGYTLPAGAVVASGDVLFETADDAVIEPSETEVEVGVVAQEPGEAANGLSGTLELVDPLVVWVDSVELVGQTSGGQEGETEDEFMNRLSDLLTLLAETLVLPDDFATLARAHPGVHRALALDTYDPDNDTFDNEKMVTVVLVDEQGLPLSSGVKAEVKALLEAKREVNFVVHVIDPTYTSVDVSVEVTLWDGFDASEVTQAVEDALTDYLSPANWGRDQFADDTEWVDEPAVYFGEVVEVVNRVPGVRRVDTLEIDGSPGYAGDRFMLAGPAALAQPGSIAVSVTGEES